MSMPASARSSRREKAKEQTGRMVSRIGDNHAVTIGDQMAVNMDSAALSIIPGDNQADARYVVQCDTIHHSAQDLLSPKRRMPSMKRTLRGRQKQNGKTKHGRLKNTKLQRVRKGKASNRSRKGSRRERARRDLLLLVLLSPRLFEQTELSLNPNQKLDHAWQTVSFRNDDNQV